MEHLNLTVVGSGAWGTALAIHFAHDHHVHLWARDPAQTELMQRQGFNTRYLPDIPLPATLQCTHDLNTAVLRADLVVFAVPTSAFRTTLSLTAPQLQNTPVLWVCKGFEAGSMLLPHQVAFEVLGTQHPCGVLSGPSFASEVARGLPTALTLASNNPNTLSLATALHHHNLRVYTSTDTVGVEVGGALKNVFAIAAGISDGLGLGHNARAALLSRGLAEMSRLGQILGGRPDTFMGLTGVGDLMLTATSDQSRNRQVGLKLAQGLQLPNILHALGHVAEGVSTADEVAKLAIRLGIEMPITHAVNQVLRHNLSPRAAVEQLLNREPKQEASL